MVPPAVASADGAPQQTEGHEGAAGKATLRVAETVLEWKEGEVLVFDDSYEHEVYQLGATDRYLLQNLRPSRPSRVYCSYRKL